MGYEASLTSLAQQNMDMLTEKLIAEGNDDFDHLVAEEVFGFLTDMSYCNTFGFLLRRYIQVTFPEFFEGYQIGIDYDDLTRSRNVPWPKELLEQLGQKLYHAVYTECGFTIQKKIWVGYLTDEQPPNRDSILRVAFVLHMSEADTVALLLSRSANIYMMRNPRDFIYYYCQKKKESYAWNDVEGLWNRYQSEVAEKHKRDVVNQEIRERVQEGWTVLAQNQDMEKLIQSTLPQKEAEDNLIAYMDEHYQEFLTFGRGTKQQDGRALNGYSFTNYMYFKRMMEYLHVLYPKYELAQERDKQTEPVLEPVPLLDVNGEKVVDVKILAKAMLQQRSMRIPYTIKVDTNYTLFETEIVQYLKKWQIHVNHIERIHHPNQYVEPVERNDVLLMVYFFVAEYWILIKSLNHPERIHAKKYTEYEDKNEKLIQMIEENSSIDTCVDLMMELIEEATEWDGEFEQTSNVFRRCINGLLEVFGFSSLYIPNLFDRFIMLLLYMTAQPEEIEMEDVLGEVLRLER